jgi:hypothetical protein
VFRGSRVYVSRAKAKYKLNPEAGGASTSAGVQNYQDLEGYMKMPERIIIFAALATVLTAGQSYADCVTSHDVTGTVTTSGPSSDYAFTVTNGCAGDHELTGFYLPYFTDADISDIVAPTGWSYSIDTSDNLFGLANAGVIDFTAGTPLVGFSFASGFGYTSNYSGVEGPDAISLTTNGVNSTVFGDPPIPGSPDALAALRTTTVPEPSTVALLAIALCAMVPGLAGWGRVSRLCD